MTDNVTSEYWHFLFGHPV